MVHKWQPIIIIIIATTIKLTFSKNIKQGKPSDWDVIETLAEEHPYIVALLNVTKSYVCTGTIIGKRTVLTSGSCLLHSPQYIAVGTAIVGKDVSANNIMAIADTKLHGDYVFELISSEPNVTHMHSNIGLVFSALSILDSVFESADIGNYYAPELRKKHLTVVGYGKLGGKSMVGLQKQAYHQSPCVNPKWYYCVCGFEYSMRQVTYEEEFGEGAPVLLGSDIVAVTATTCGSLSMPHSGYKYNVFTVIGPYIMWIDKAEPTTESIKFKALRSSNNNVLKTSIRMIFLLIMSKVLI